MSNSLRRTNLSIGIGMIIMFAISGQLMRHYYHNADLHDVERLYRRSRHLFLLMAALTQGGIGIYIRPFQQNVSHKMQWIATALMTLGAGFLTAAFFFEIPTSITNTPLSRIGLYSLLASIVFHFTAFLVEQNRQRSSKIQQVEVKELQRH